MTRRLPFRRLASVCFFIPSLTTDVYLNDRVCKPRVYDTLDRLYQ